jgi:drug/metabolite transporter superfamily protein YnfA
MRNREKGDVSEFFANVAFGLLVVAVVVVVAVAAARAGRACEARGGVFLTREWACVAGPR